MFELAPQLLKDTFFVMDWELSRIVLMNNQYFPWLILIPRRNGLKEIYQLEEAERALLIEEICQSTQCLEQAFKADKMNVGALGNQVSQLHIHIIARKKTDLAWPLPVWGSGHHLPYEEGEQETIVPYFKSLLSEVKF